MDANKGTSLFTMVRVQDDLAKMIGVKVYLRTPGDLHPRFRDKVLTEAAAL